MALINEGRPFRSIDAAACGLNRRQFAEARHAGALFPIFRGVVVDSRSADSRELRIEAASLVVPPNAVVADHTAAWLYGADTLPPGDMRELRPMFLVPHSTSRPFSAAGTVRQTTIPDPDVVHIGGLQVTSPLRPAADLLRRCWRPYALAAGDALARAKVVSAEEVAEYVLRLRKQRGVIQARELAQVIDSKAASHGESWMRCRMLDAGLPRPELDFEIHDHWGNQWRRDSAYATQRVASEYDGRGDHTGPEAIEHDEGRRSTIEQRLSWKFVIATRERIFGAEDSFEHELGKALSVPIRPRRW